MRHLAMHPINDKLFGGTLGLWDSVSMCRELSCLGPDFLVSSCKPRECLPRPVEMWCSVLASTRRSRSLVSGRIPATNWRRVSFFRRLFKMWIAIFFEPSHPPLVVFKGKVGRALGSKIESLSFLDNPPLGRIPAAKRCPCFLHGSRASFHFHSFQSESFQSLKIPGWKQIRFLKGTMLEKNGVESTPAPGQA